VAASDYTSQVRAPRAEVLEFIAQDLSEAIADLPAKNALTTGNKFRAHKGTAQALLGKAYLYLERWEEAADAFEDVITSTHYGLESDPMAPFNKNNKFGEESLFELNFGGDNGGNFPWGFTSDDNIIIQLMGPRGDFYTRPSTDSLIGGWGFNTPKKELYDAFVAAGDTYRRQRFLMSEAELKAKGGNWSNPTAWDYEGLLRRKYGTFNNQSGFPGQDPTSDEFNYGTNFILLRYSDVLLMAAEANLKSGDEDKARIYLNMVRDRAGLNDSNASGDALFNAIVLERRLELAFEGHRFADLVRWGLAETELQNLGFVKGKHEVLPIPNADVIAGKLSQNPNY
jgi:starch-binding outer membrane protein, SusD/RagB family